MRIARVLAVAAFVVFAIAGSASAGPPGQWTRLPGTVINFAEPGLARTSDGVLHVVFTRRNGNKVLVKMITVRSTITPTDFEIKEGDEVTVAITNIEQTTDELHGFGLLDYNINIVIDPGETKTVTFTAKKNGVFAYYCTNFCSALHQEMQGYFTVKPR